MVTPLTDLAAKVFDKLPASQKNATAASDALNKVAKAIYPSFTGADLLTPPTVVNSATPAFNSGSKADVYAALLGGLATSAKNSGGTIESLMTQLSTDADDGTLGDDPNSFYTNLTDLNAKAEQSAATYAASTNNSATATTATNNQNATPAQSSSADVTPSSGTGGA